MGGNGARLKRYDWMANERTLAQHQRIVGELRNRGYADATYNVSSLRVVSYDDGYSVTFWNTGDVYTPEEYADRVNEFLKYVKGHITTATKTDGQPIINFRIPSIRTALRLARKYKQESIYDWKRKRNIIVTEARKRGNR